LPSDFVRGEAQRILEIFYSTPFNECHPLTREFSTLPARSGIYAFRHQAEGILYIGKAVNIRQRLRGGHKAFAWAFIDRLNPDDVRIVALALPYQSWLQALEIEALMIQIVKPCYNIRMRQEE
jgi:excinuclease UvrABC nuclease subunit